MDRNLPVNKSTVAITAETLSLFAGVYVTPVTEITVVVVPRSLRSEQARAGGMKTRVRSSHTIGVAMASAPGTRRIIGVVARSAIFYIPAGRPAVLGKPRDRRMQKWNAVFTLMAVVTKRTVVVAPATFDPFVFRVQSVRIEIIEVVYVSRKIVAAVTIEAVFILSMALRAPIPFERRPCSVLMAPLSGVNVGQGEIVGVT
jgi:hypothetical protein